MNPGILALVMLCILVFTIMIGFPVAFTLMALGVMPLDHPLFGAELEEVRVIRPRLLFRPEVQIPRPRSLFLEPGKEHVLDLDRVVAVDLDAVLVRATGLADRVLEPIDALRRVDTPPLTGADPLVDRIGRKA